MAEYEHLEMKQFYYSFEDIGWYLLPCLCQCTGCCNGSHGLCLCTPYTGDPVCDA